MDLLTNLNLKFEDISPDDDMYPDRHLHSIVEARYIKRQGGTDNPDIAALPYPATIPKIMDASTIPIPGYDFDDVKDEPKYRKKEGVLLLQQAYAPLGHIIDMAQAVDTALFTSYMAREVRTTTWKGDKLLVDNGVPANVYSIRSGLVGRASSFVISGASGCGKTVAMNIIRNMYPQAIHHVVGDYEYLQIPIIMVTSLVGNMSELMISIASAIDDIIGIGPIWRKRAMGRNVGLSANVIKEAIRTLHVGLIVIDESQFLKFDASNSSLENLVGIAEDTGCALGFIGNTELISKMNRYPRLVGRTMLNRIEVGFKEQTNQMLFRQAVSLLWRYQWTKEFTPLTDEILDELVRDSMYNVAILKALLMRIQFQAISKFPKDGITPEYIHEISESRFAEVRTLVLSDSTETEHDLMLLLQKNTDEIADDAKKLALRARKNLIEKQEAEARIWDAGKLKDVKTMLKYFGIDESQTKRALTRLVKQDANLPNMDSPYIVDAVRKMIGDASVDPAFKSKARKQRRKELDEAGEALIKEVIAQELTTGGVKA